MRWARSWQRVRDRIAKSPDKSIEKLVFSKIASKITEIKGGENVVKCFKALCGQIKVTSLLEVIPDLNKADAEYVNQQCDWTTAAHWAAWWMRPAHLQMLHKDFSTMTSDVWNKINVQITRMLSRQEIKIAKMDHRFPSGNALSACTNWIRHFVPNFLLQKMVTTCLTTVKLLSQKSQQLRPGSHKGRGQYWLKKIMNHNLGHPQRHNILMIQERGM